MVGMPWQWLARGLMAPPLLVACGGSNEVQAIRAAAVMVAAVGVNRALTGECWAACAPGYACDHDSGLCVPGECSPRCPETQACASVAGELMCTDKGFPQVAWGSAAASPSASASAIAKPPPACAHSGTTQRYREHAEAPAPPGALSADFVGIWSVVGAEPTAAADAPRPLIVTHQWFGYSERAATRYRVSSESGALLVLDASSELSPTATELSVEFTSRDRLRLRGVDYQREACGGAGSPGACCGLPRAPWVRLGPSP